jgi:hypothetical protein
MTEAYQKVRQLVRSSVIADRCDVFDLPLAARHGCLHSIAVLLPRLRVHGELSCGEDGNPRAAVVVQHSETDD